MNKIATMEDWRNGNPENDADVARLNNATVVIPAEFEWTIHERFSFYRVPSPGTVKRIRWVHCMGKKEFLLQ